MANDTKIALEHAVHILQQDGAKQYEIEHFTRQFELVNKGFDGYILESSIEPLDKPHAYEDLSQAESVDFGIASLKLNGGLGTTMGLQGPKSLLPVKGGHTFLSLVLEQYSHGLQGDELLLMNSFNTHDFMNEYMRKNDVSNVSCFEQGRVPRLQVTDLEPLDPAQWGKDAWCPPGHGQLMDILVNGLAQELINRGIRYLFVSNIDNLGAVVDASIPAHMAERGVPWLMEVCERTASDRKGGHLATNISDDSLLVRDLAMTSEQDIEAFQDISKHRYFNTNNLWLDLTALDTDLFDHLDLPLIVNHKFVTQGDQTVNVLQLETALGTAISNFVGAEALLVPRSRFIPVKDIPQWLVLRSDWFTIGYDGSYNEPEGEERPTLNADDVMRGTAAETLEYYLEHPDDSDNNQINILQ